MESMLLCEDCGWLGQQGDCVKVRDYRDIETHLQCPKCGSENLIELAGRGARLPEPALVG